MTGRITWWRLKTAMTQKTRSVLSKKKVVRHWAEILRPLWLYSEDFSQRKVWLPSEGEVTTDSTRGVRRAARDSEEDGEVLRSKQSWRTSREQEVHFWRASETWQMVVLGPGSMRQMRMMRGGRGGGQRVSTATPWGAGSPP